MNLSYEHLWQALSVTLSFVAFDQARRLFQWKRRHNKFVTPAEALDYLEKQIRRGKSSLEHLSAEIEAFKESCQKTRHSLLEQIQSLTSERNYEVSEHTAREYGLYRQDWDFPTEMGFRSELESIYRNQKELIKNGNAVYFKYGMTIDNSKSKGKSFQQQCIKIMLGAVPIPV